MGGLGGELENKRGRERENPEKQKCGHHQTMAAGHRRIFAEHDGHDAKFRRMEERTTIQSPTDLSHEQHGFWRCFWTNIDAVLTLSDDRLECHCDPDKNRKCSLALCVLSTEKRTGMTLRLCIVKGECSRNWTKVAAKWVSMKRAALVSLFWWLKLPAERSHIREQMY